MLASVAEQQTHRTILALRLVWQEEERELIRLDHYSKMILRYNPSSGRSCNYWCRDESKTPTLCPSAKNHDSDKTAYLQKLKQWPMPAHTAWPPASLVMSTAGDILPKNGISFG